MLEGLDKLDLGWEIFHRTLSQNVREYLHEIIRTCSHHLIWTREKADRIIYNHGCIQDESQFLVGHVCGLDLVYFSDGDIPDVVGEFIV